MKKILLILAIFSLSSLRSPSICYASNIATARATVDTEIKENLKNTELPKISVTSKSTLKQNFSKLLDRLSGKNNNPVIKIINPIGEESIVQTIPNGRTELALSDIAKVPGVYQVKVDDTVLSRFTWGVLVLNHDKSSYNLGETAYLQMASLSSAGHTLCNSHLALKVITPSKKITSADIESSNTCDFNNVTDSPDYFANYPLNELGRYELELTNIDNGYTTKSFFDVKDQSPITIERVGATRINPFKSDYQMTIKITTSQDFSGTVKETLPDGFTALSQISWQLSLKSGETKNLTYTYTAPKVSPELFFLGPLSVGSYEEPNPWGLASDATFTMQTGYYIGDGADNRAITGVGFQPELVYIKDDTAGGTDGVIWKSSVMSSQVSALLGEAEADISTDSIQSLDSDGFTIGTDDDINSSNVRYTWVAFRGSDCTSSGTFCVNSYTGDGSATHALTTVGFQPDLVMVKSSTNAGAGIWKTSSMATNVAQSFGATNETTGGTEFKTLDSTGFTVGNATTTNTNAVNYWYVAFKTTASAFAVGTYTGDGAASKAITVGFQPQYAWVKNSNATTPVSAAFALTESSDDYASKADDAVNATALILTLDATTFTVGSAAATNENTKTLYWFAFAGATNPTGTGTYLMKVGSYTGTGSSQAITGVGFAPSLVIIKHATAANSAVFRTLLMKGDTTAYIGATLADITAAITSLDSDGFTVNTDATVNTSSGAYQYMAFGNAFNPETNTGAADFALYTFSGNGGDNRDIHRMPFQPDLIAIKASGTSAAMWRTSNESGDNSLPISNGAEAADSIQAINTDGFEVGTTRVNGSSNLLRGFLFKASTTMVVNNYTGTASAQNITTPGFSPDLVWVKNVGAVAPVFKPSSLAGDTTVYFVASASLTDRITGFVSTGFSIGGNRTETNTTATTYRYAAWVINSAPTTPTLDAPTDTATNQLLSPALQTTATDTNSDYLRYKIELCTNVGMTTGCQTFDQTSSQTGWSGQNAQTSTAYTSGTQATYTIQSALTASTTYYWRSYAKDPAGSNTWSGTQTPKSFTTTTAPSAPTTPYAEGAANPTGIIDLTPEFSAIHNDSDSDAAIYYDIDVNTASDFSGTYLWNSGITSMSSLASGVRSTDVSYAGTALTYNGTTYYWRIRFVDVKGALGAWSATQNFSTNIAPSTPSLDSPVDTATGQSITPSLLTTGSDTNSDYLRYKIELCTNVGMSAGCQTFDQTSSQTGWSGQNTQTSTAYTSGTQATYTIQSSLTNSTTYYWRSYAIDPAGTNSWSTTQTPYSFTTVAGGGGGGGSVQMNINGINFNGININ